MKKILNFEDYGITQDGNVFSYKRKKFIRKRKDHYGYLRVKLYKNGKCFYKLIHKLVAEAYIPNPNNLETVDHIDFNKENNNVSNLRWMTNKENSMRKNKNYGMTVLSCIGCDECHSKQCKNNKIERLLHSIKE